MEAKVHTTKMTGPRAVETIFSDAWTNEPGTRRTIAVRHPVRPELHMKKTLEIETFRDGERMSRLIFEPGFPVDVLRRAIELARSRNQVGPLVIDTLTIGRSRVVVSAGRDAVEGGVAFSTVRNDGRLGRPTVIARRELAGLAEAVHAMTGAKL